MRYVFLLLVAACSMTPRNTDREFDIYVSVFEKACGVSVTVPITKADLKHPVIGVCNYGMFKWQRNIKIDRKFWAYSSYDQKLEVILHELGHCVLDRDHTPWLGIMYEFSDSSDFGRNKEKQIKDLCEGR